MEEKIIKIMQLVQIKKDNTVEFNAPTQIHRMVTPKMMLPLIDDKLQEKFKETEARE